MYYTVYKITNKIDGKFYIGQHQTKKLDDDYFGSGKYLQHAINKHGKENFKKEILFVFETEQEMNQKERELITEEFCDRDDTYNICSGGFGGFGYINQNGLTFDINEYLKKLDENHPSKIAQKNGPKKAYLTCKNLKIGIYASDHNSTTYGFLGKKHTDETKQKMSQKKRGKIPWNKGIPRTQEEKDRIRQGMLKK